ncbi:S8 family serine peptidase [Kordiimonas sp. UBA4487]|jgi:subtilisin-like proprotein convertase family protein|uniref:S8 family serine peptidase n=1 Tax=Kordiimonas sp. UBA4487 TaxID=1946675 RepID=UPI00257F088A|nr:S8 family serine peptidase [Kordiimonas sp. UBA4487]
MGGTSTDIAAPETTDGADDGYTIPFGDFAGTYVPFNDPLFPFQANLTGFMVDGTGAYTESAHINIIPVWDEYDGSGVLIGSAEPIDPSAPDLIPNFSRLNNYTHENFLGFIANLGAAHGTKTAGIFGAEANNGIGVVGIAFGAEIVGDVAYTIETGGYIVGDDFIEHIPVNSVDIINVSLTSGGALGDSNFNLYDQYTSDLVTGRSGLGTIWITSAGNQGHRDGSLDTPVGLNHLEILPVSWINADGFVNYVTSFGASMHIAAPLSTLYGNEASLTTDRPGNYGDVLEYGAEIPADANYGQTTPRIAAEYFSNFPVRVLGGTDSDFNSGNYALISGTSGAAPTVTGVTALVLQAGTNNIFGDTDLGWRDVQEILAISSAHTGSALGTGRDGLHEYEHNPWIINGSASINGGGFHWSSDYGFGMVDAHAAVRLAETWTMTRHSGNLMEQSHAFQTSDETITYGADLTFSFRTGDTEGLDLDGVTLSLDITHDVWAELEMVLVSPSGTSIIVYDTPRLTAEDYDRSEQTGNLVWDILARGFWGEESAGEWTLVIRDTVDNGNSGTVNSLSLTFLGDAATDDDTYYFTDDWALMNAANGGVPVLDDALGQNSVNAAALMDAVLLKLAPGSTSKIGGETAFKTSSDAVFTMGIGTDQDDTLVGAAFDETLYGMQGDDRMWAGAGDLGADSYYGGSGDDIIGVGAGNDLAVGEGGNDAMFGGSGDDTLVGGFWEGGTVDPTGGGHNELWAGSGDDVIHGANGNDALGGGADSDIIYGYAGNDVLYAGGGAVADTLDGGAGQDTLFGGGGDDNLAGGGGDDLLFNGAGNDTVAGDDGGDTLWGGGGDDTLTGGTGADTFAFTATNGSDTVTDFGAAEDILLLDGSGFADLAALKAATTEDSTGVTISFGDTVILLSGISLDDLTTDNVML